MSTESIPNKTITATVRYRLSAQGQKTALLAGKNAALKQQITGEIPADLLDMCDIDPDGGVIADYVQNVFFTQEGSRERWANWASYCTDQDRPADSAADLLTRLREGIQAKADEIKAKHAQTQAEQQARSAQMEAEYEAWLEATQRALDQDPAAIPASNPPHRNYTWRDSDVPAAVEIRRRKAALERRAAAAAEAAKQAQRAAVRAWLAEHGAPDQVERFDAGLLPDEELRGAMADWAFAGLAEFPRYVRISAAEVREAVDEMYADCEAQYRAVDPPSLTGEQWATLKRMRAACPGARITPQLHEATVDANEVAWGVVERYSALAAAEAAGVELRREYALL